MRKIVLQMMTTLNGRLDDPAAWVHGVDDAQYRDIERLYAGFDTVLVGRTTYEEMAAYWPKALAESEGTPTNQAMAKRMHDYRKLVFSRSGDALRTKWHNSELVTTKSDEDLKRQLSSLKGASGGDIHLSGGATLAATVVGLGLVDEFQLLVYPVVSPGATWFAKLPAGCELTLVDATAYPNGVVRGHYRPRAAERKTAPASFTDLLTQ
jgi:dihydrofolate reductase